MRDRTATRERYLRDDVAIRLGGLAANLLRVKSFCEHNANRDMVENLIDESKFFIEWTASDTGVDVAAELVELQVQLAGWQRQWAGIWSDDQRRRALAQQSGAWSRRVLNLSGLLRA
jgi:hypothetical protein